jgi:hypothetical protein
VATTLRRRASAFVVQFSLPERNKTEGRPNSRTTASWGCPARPDTIQTAPYAKRELKGRRRDRELELLNRHAKELNAEGNDSAAYQAAWDPE